jgi:tRNA dimethylallyltransferase
MDHVSGRHRGIDIPRAKGAGPYLILTHELAAPSLIMPQSEHELRQMPPDAPPAIIVAGPTASGKSALAIGLARRIGGTIVNADSMQVYCELRVLTARPSPEDEASVPHVLYGIRPVADAGNVVWWRGAALAAMEAASKGGRIPILTGGTGLYFSAMTQGIADIPDAGVDAREEARRMLGQLGPEVLHASLAKVDPATASRLSPNDGQRIARAWEVWRGTGMGLAAWQSRMLPPARWRFFAIRLDPPRDQLRLAIASRFTMMLAAGAVEEVQALLALGVDPSLPAMRAHGVPEISAYLRGILTLEEAGRRTEQVTGQYTKRQLTWFRHHELADLNTTEIIPSRWTADTQLSESLMAKILAFIQSRD